MIRPPFSPGARSGKTGTGLLLAAEAGEALVELGDLAALVVEAGGAAGPGRMRGRIDVEHHGVARQIGRAHAELQSLMRISYAVFCLKKKTKKNTQSQQQNTQL